MRLKNYGLLIMLFASIFIICSSTMLHKNNLPQLHYLVREPKIKTDHPPLLILLHGVGGNEKNLFIYANQLPDKYLVVFVRGPLTLGSDSYAWFQVDFSTGKPVVVAEQAEASRKALLQFIEDFKNVRTFDESRVSLLGFSQGGIMSYSVALTAPETIERIAVMSGRLLPEIKPIIATNEQLKKLKVFIAHGTQDAVLQYQYALDAASYLKRKGLTPDFHTYNEGHHISHEMLQDVITWLR